MLLSKYGPFLNRTTSYFFQTCVCLFFFGFKQLDTKIHVAHFVQRIENEDKEQKDDLRNTQIYIKKMKNMKCFWFLLWQATIKPIKIYRKFGALWPLSYRITEIGANS